MRYTRGVDAGRAFDRRHLQGESLVDHTTVGAGGTAHSELTHPDRRGELNDASIAADAVLLCRALSGDRSKPPRGLRTAPAGSTSPCVFPGRCPARILTSVSRRRNVSALPARVGPHPRRTFIAALAAVFGALLDVEVWGDETGRLGRRLVIPAQNLDVVREVSHRSPRDGVVVSRPGDEQVRDSYRFHLGSHRVEAGGLRRQDAGYRARRRIGAESIGTRRSPTSRFSDSWPTCSPMPGFVVVRVSTSAVWARAAGDPEPATIRRLLR